MQCVYPLRTPGRNTNFRSPFITPPPDGPHYCPTRYARRRACQIAMSVGCCADRRAEGVHGEYEAQARVLDARHHAGVADPERRPILTRLSTYPRVRGLVIGAFAETSADVRLRVGGVPCECWWAGARAGHAPAGNPRNDLIRHDGCPSFCVASAFTSAEASEASTPL